MKNIPEKIATASRFGLPAGLLLAVWNYFQMQGGDTPVELIEMAKYLLGPLLGGWAVSSVASPLEHIKVDGGTSHTRDVLGSIQTLLETSSPVLDDGKFSGLLLVRDKKYRISVEEVK